MGENALLNVSPLGFPWQPADPFLVCVHHVDGYPAANDAMGPATSLTGRDLGQDFEGRDGWRMYHGTAIPGFPQHPHRGFETVTIVRRGFIDHADSLGATARYGEGDVQWLTAGRGVVHSEMFPLLDREHANPLELFQIWLNLPGAEKLAPREFSMFWRESLPTLSARDAEGRAVDVAVVAGSVENVQPLAPPAHSWASRPENEVAIWTIGLAPRARWTLPHAAKGLNRDLFAFRGGGLRVAGRDVRAGSRVSLRSDAAVGIENGDEHSDLLLLQGRPIGEPVVQHGPFVMNTPSEIRQAFADYQRTRFGGWPWPNDEPVHPRSSGRFARHPDGRVERPGSSLH